MNLISEDDFDYTTLNHISPTPSPITSPNQSPKHTSLPIDETIVAQNQLVEFSASLQPSPMNTMLETPYMFLVGKLILLDLSQSMIQKVLKLILT